MCFSHCFKVVLRLKERSSESEDVRLELETRNGCTSIIGEWVQVLN